MASSNAVATLAGYGLVWLELGGDKKYHVVVAESSIRFLRPVRETIRAICSRPSATEMSSFREMLASEGKARLKLAVTVEEENAIAAGFAGTFVVFTR